jgi:hypothetical protein
MMLAHHGKSEGRSSMKMEQSCAFEVAVQKHDFKQPTFASVIGLLSPSANQKKKTLGWTSPH